MQITQNPMTQAQYYVKFRVSKLPYLVSWPVGNLKPREGLGQGPEERERLVWRRVCEKEGSLERREWLKRNFRKPF